MPRNNVQCWTNLVHSICKQRVESCSRCVGRAGGQAGDQQAPLESLCCTSPSTCTSNPAGSRLIFRNLPNHPSPVLISALQPPSLLPIDLTLHVDVCHLLRNPQTACVYVLVAFVIQKHAVTRLSSRKDAKHTLLMYHLVSSRGL